MDKLNIKKIFKTEVAITNSLIESYKNKIKENTDSSFENQVFKDVISYESII
jgi:hypothetical protein